MRRSRHLVAAATTVSGLVAAVALPMLASPASAATYTASGTITLPAPVGNGATDLEFTLTCPNAPTTQGVEGYVFALPAAYAVAGTTVDIVGSDAENLHDIAAYVYKSDCTYDRIADDTTSQDLSITLTAGDTFLSVFTGLGHDVTVDLTATPGTAPTTTPPTTPPTSSSAPPTPGTYPTTPNDPLFLQNGANDLLLAGQWGLRKINAPQAWQVATGAGIKVGILDTGLDINHPDFNCAGKVQLLPGNESDPDPDGNTVPDDDVEGHGTHVAGIIGACTDNGIGVAGVAPDATLMPIQVLSATSDASTLATALHTATDEGAHVVNMSLGFGIHDPLLGLTIPMTGTAVGWTGGLPEIEEAVEYAVSHGVVVVAAAGNESSPLCGYPAIAYNVVCVGASDPRDLNSWYGNFPVKDDDTDLLGPGLLAPGGAGVIVFCDFSASEIISTYARSVDQSEGDCDGNFGYTSIQGTSMATPHVAGVAALVYDKLGGTRSVANAEKVVEALTNSAVDLYTPGYDPMSGSGRLDALGAVNYWP